MTVHVGDLSTEVSVIPDSSPATAGQSEPTPWELQERLRRVGDRLLRDLTRTSAEDFDD